MMHTRIEGRTELSRCGELGMAGLRTLKIFGSVGNKNISDS